MSFTNDVKQDVKDAGVRIVSKQISAAVKGSILTLMKKNKMRKSQLNALSDFLDTELGGAVLELVLGWGLTYVPMISDDPRVKRVSEEFRIKGMAGAGNVLVEAVAEKALPLLTQSMNLLDDKKRIATEEEADDEPQELNAKAVVK